MALLQAHHKLHYHCVRPQKIKPRCKAPLLQVTTHHNDQDCKIETVQILMKLKERIALEGLEGYHSGHRMQRTHGRTRLMTCDDEGVWMSGV